MLSVAAVPPQICYRQTDVISCSWWMLGLMNAAPGGWFIMSHCHPTGVPALEISPSAGMSCWNLWRLKDFMHDLIRCAVPPIRNDTKWIELDVAVYGCLIDSAPWICPRRTDGGGPDTRPQSLKALTYCWNSIRQFVLYLSAIEGVPELLSLLNLCDINCLSHVNYV